MGTRRHSREDALKVLYQIEMTGQKPADALRAFWQCSESDEESRGFAEFLVTGVTRDLARIDELISAHSTNWKLSRMAAVDKNILRMAVFELMSCSETPAKVAINEAVDIAKRFGSSDSGAFVNGILDNVARGISADGGEKSDV